jgi:uncharacterized protein YjbI with pentapeptide repeats
VTVPQLNPTSLSLSSSGWQLHPPSAVLTVVAKATCDLVDGEPARVRDEAELPAPAVFESDSPQASLRYASDYAVKKERADVTLVGHAHAPGGAAQRMEVGLSFGAGDARIARRMAVIADRAWGAEPTTSFSRMPLTWERAFGGPELEANPVGRGLRGGQVTTADGVIDGALVMPNLEDPNRLLVDRGDRPSPMCFAPISPSWRPRAAKMGTFDETWAKTRAPYLPADLDPAFFQAAPAAQQIPFPRGDEPFELVGVLEGKPKLSGSLPGIRARCFAKMAAEAGGAFNEIPMQLDTIAFDTDEEVVHLVWRGVMDVETVEAWEIERLFLQTERLDAPLSLEEAHRAYTSAELAFHAFAESAVGGPSAAPPVAGPAAAGMAAASAAVAMAQELPMPDVPDEVRATREQVLAQLDAGKPIAELSLVDADLSGMDLSNANLSGAVLLRAVLQGTTLSGANLEGVQLGEADLSDARLDGANLTLCDLSRAKLDRAVFDRTTLDNARFDGAIGEDTSFAGASGKLVSFAGAELRRAKLDDVSLDIADFSSASLEEVSLCRATIAQARLFDTHAEKARIEHATFVDASAVGANLSGSSLRGLEAPESVWERAALDGCDFTSANLAGASFAGASCVASVFRGADMRGATLRKANLARAAMTGADLMEATFEQTDLTRADLCEANLFGTAGWGAILEGAKTEGAIVDQSAVFGQRA